MKRKSKLYLIVVSTLALLSSYSVDVFATLEVNDPPKISQQNSTQSFKVPISKSTEQWSVTMGKAIYDQPNMAKSKPGVADMYSITIKNSGVTAYNVRLEAYRNEPNSQTKLQLFSHQIADRFNSGKDWLVHKNLPISVKAEELEIVVYWELEQDQDKTVQGKKVARTWKQSFVFNPNKE